MQARPPKLTGGNRSGIARGAGVPEGDQTAIESAYQAIDAALDALAEGLRQITIALRLLRGPDQPGVRERVLRVVRLVESEVLPD